MIQKTKHDRQKFINELQSKWQKKFRNSRNWLDDEELAALEELDSFWEDSFSSYHDTNRNRKVTGWS